MPWVYGGNWDGRRVQDLPAIMCSVIEQLNLRFEALGLSEWVDEDSLYFYDKFVDKNGDELDFLTYPVAADYDGLPVSSTVFQDNYDAAIANAKRLSDGMEYYYNSVGDNWKRVVGPKSRSWQYVTSEDDDTGDGVSVGLKTWSAGDLPTLENKTPRNEKQTLTITATGGTFTLSFKGQTTPAIAYNAANSVIATTLWALSTVGDGNISVTGTSPKTIEFIGQLKELDHPLITVGTAGLTGGTATIAINTEGWPGLVRPAGNGIEAWLNLKEYLDALTVVRFAWYDTDDFYKFDVRQLSRAGTVTPDQANTTYHGWLYDMISQLWNGSTFSIPAEWGSTSDVFTDMSALQDGRIFRPDIHSSLTATWAKDYSGYEARLSAETEYINTLSTGGEMLTASGGTAIRSKVKGSATHSFSIEINDEDPQSLDGNFDVVFDPTEEEPEVPEAFTVTWTPFPDFPYYTWPSAPPFSDDVLPEFSVDPAIAKRILFPGYVVYRDMSAEF